MNRERGRLFLGLLAVAVVAHVAAADVYDAPAIYYNAATNTGASLLSQLRAIISEMHGVTYGDARYSAPITDADPTTTGNILLIYDRASVSSVWDNVALPWNREHIWPETRLGASASNGTANIASDQFNLRPADTYINNARGNDPFGLDNTSGNFGPVGSYFYPGDADAGDVARSQFYMATRYSTISLTDSTPSGTQMGDLSSLVTFHFRDAPDAFERRRNHAIYGLAGSGGPAINNPYRQENRNPYVDHPEFVWSVFVDQANDSRIAIDGAVVDINGGSSRDVDLGRIFVGNAVPAGQALALSKTGSDGTYFEVSTVAAATSSLAGRYNSFRTNQVDSKMITVGLDITTTTSGIKSGTVIIDNLDITTGGGAGRGANDADDSINVSLTVLDHATPSFDGGGVVATLLHDFGSVAQGTVIPAFSFDVFNFGVLPTFTAGLDFDSVLAEGDSGVFTADLAGEAGTLHIAGGASHEFVAQFDTSTPGSFSATYTLSLSDEDLLGALSKSLTLTLLGEVIPTLLAGDYNLDHIVDAADYTLWRNSLGTSVAAYEGADGNGNMLIDEDDYLVWKNHFGETNGSAAADQAAVPEPAAWLPALSALVATACRRRNLSAAGRHRVRTADLKHAGN